MLINLVSNAIKFTPRGGEVTVVGRRDPGDGAMVLVVSDTGIGMTDKEIEIALSPYGQVKTPHTAGKKGTGLGLPLTRKLVEQLGGTLEVVSTPGVGTRVHLRFPPDLVAS